MVKPIKIILDDPYYYPGSVVKGSVLVSADKPKQYVKISIEILGFARAKWTESNGSRTYTLIENTLRYIEQKCVLWSRERSPTGNLPAGEHSFPFSVQLPYQAPPSFKSFTGKIVYQMLAKITHRSINSHAIATLDVRSHIPRLCMRPKDEELDSRLTFCCCYNFGQVIVNCSIPRSGYVTQEAIPISMEIDNQSNKNIYIHASISKIVEYKSGRDQTKTCRSCNLSVSKSQSIPPGTTSLLEKLLNIPRKLPVSITNCPVLSVNYFLVIQANASTIGSSETMKIPIVIAHAPPTFDDYIVDQVLGMLCGQFQ